MRCRGVAVPKAIASRRAIVIRLPDLGYASRRRSRDSAETKRRDDDREYARKHRRHDGSEVRRDTAGEGEDVERAEHRELERHRLSDEHICGVRTYYEGL